MVNKLNSCRKKYALIGCGASGMGVLKTLNLKKGDKLDIFDSRTHGTGFAYDKKEMLSLHLLNMSLEDMSYQDDNHFKDWLINNKSRCHQFLDTLFEEEIIKDAKKKYGNSYSDNASFQEEYSQKLNNFKGLKKRVFNLDKIEHDFYAPRVVYGLYLQDNLNQQLEKFKSQGAKVRLINSQIDNLVVSDNNKPYVIKMRSNRLQKFLNRDKKSYDKVVIATGHWKRTPSVDRKISLWPARDMKIQVIETISKDANKIYQTTGSRDINLKIAMLGTSLSSIDGLKTLFQDSLQYSHSSGELTINKKPFQIQTEDGTNLAVNLSVDMISRNGYLPKVRSNRVRGTNLHLTAANVQEIIQFKGHITLKDLWMLLKEDINRVYCEHNIDNPFKNISELPKKECEEGFDNLRQALMEAEQGTSYWQEVYSQAAEPFRMAYPYLPAQDKIILSKIKSLHQAYYAPIPQKNAEELLLMHDKGLVFSRSLKDGNLHADGSEIYYTDKNTNSRTDYSVIIDAMGQDVNALSDQRVLFQRLKSQGLVSSVIEDKQPTSQELTEEPYISFRADIDKYTQQGITQFDTGQLKRTNSLRLIGDDNMPTAGLYAVGVTASKFGITRAKAMFQEGEIVGSRLSQNA